MATAHRRTRWLAWVWRILPHRFHPRLVRRTHVVCPETGETFQVDIALGLGPEQRRVLRCARQPDRDVSCSEACLRDPRSWSGPADALLILPPGRGVPDEVD